MKYSIAYRADVFFNTDPCDGGKLIGTKKVIIVLAEHFAEAFELVNVAMKFDTDIFGGIDLQNLLIEYLGSFGLTADNVMR